MRQLVAIGDWLSTYLRDIPPLLFRLILAYGFYHPWQSKFQNIDGTAEFFGSVGIPVPYLAAWVTMIVEGLGIIFLFFGFITRIWAIPMGVIMVVAITTVHWGHGFRAATNGFEVPLYYLLMLFSLFVTGPGKISIDALFAAPYRRRLHPKK